MPLKFYIFFELRITYYAVNRINFLFLFQRSTLTHRHAIEFFLVLVNMKKENKNEKKTRSNMGASSNVSWLDYIRN